MHRDSVNAVSDLGGRVGKFVRGFESLVNRTPGPTAVVRTEGARGRDRNKDSVGIARIEEDCVQTHPTGAGLPEVSLRATQPGKFLPGLGAVGRAKESGVFHPRVDHVRIGQRWLEMPDALELPRMLRAVIPLMSAGRAVVIEVLTHRLPSLAAVVGTLDHLAKPARRLRGVDPVRINRGAFEVIDFPAREVRTADLPILALPVGGK